MKVTIQMLNKGNIIASVNLEFETIGLTIRDCKVMEGKNGKFVSFPCRTYEKDGKKGYFNYVVFEPEKKKAIESEILKLIDAQNVQK